MTRLICPLYKQARDNPQAPAVIDGKKTLSFKELERRVLRMEEKLKGLGIRPGERVALFLDKNAGTLIVLYALWRIKAVAVILNVYLPQAAVKKQLNALNVSRLICSKARKKKGLNKKTVLLDKLRSLKTGGNKPSEAVQFPAERTVTILYTSGSMGEAKAAAHSFGNYLANAQGSNKHIPFRKGDRWLLSLPLYHVGGLGIIFRALAGGGAIVIPTTKRLSLKELRGDQITHLSLVPTQMYRLLQEQGAKRLPRLKCMLLGGAPVPPTLIEKAVKRKWPVYTTYGLTEMTSQVATSNKITGTRRRVSGKILPHARVRIDKHGQILLKGPSLFKGYVKEKRLSKPFDKKGWFKTEDMGRVIDGRRLVVTGRRGNMFISGGENIQPEEIEKHLLSLPGIRNACVVPKISPEFGERPVAILQPVKGKKLKRQPVETFLAQKIEKYKLPDEYYYWPREPATEGLKFSRAKLLATYTNKRGQLIRIN